MNISPVQKKLLYDLVDKDATPGSHFPWVECHGHEWRTALALYRMGLVELDRDAESQVKHSDFFEIRIRRIEIPDMDTLAYKLGGSIINLLYNLVALEKLVQQTKLTEKAETI